LFWNNFHRIKNWRHHAVAILCYAIAGKVVEAALALANIGTETAAVVMDNESPVIAAYGKLWIDILGY
jgi:hypothetical protein